MLRVERTGENLLSVNVRGPFRADQLGAFAYARVVSDYTKRIESATDELEDPAVFESFEGRAANDNTLALYDEIVQRRPHLVI